MVRLFVISAALWGSYTAVILIGSFISTLLGITPTFVSIWGILCIFVISSFVASVVDERFIAKDNDEKDHPTT